MKLEFLIPGSANDAFFSQLAMFRLALDHLGGPYERARVVLCLRADGSTDVPSQWKEHLERVEVVRPPHDYVRLGGSNGMFRYESLGADKDVSVLCDADTMLLRPFDPGDLEKFARAPAVRGVVAHMPPPLADADGHDYSLDGAEHFWRTLSRRCLGTEIPMPHLHTLKAEPTFCPFYLNYGFVIGNTKIFRRVREKLIRLMPEVRGYLNNYFGDQIGLALACESAGVPTETLPMRFNFPNDKMADALYPEELANAVVMHYLRTDCFDRHRIFASAAAFEQFLELTLTGSDKLFQRRVLEITRGNYPFESSKKKLRLPKPLRPCYRWIKSAYIAAQSGRFVSINARTASPAGS